MKELTMQELKDLVGGVVDERIAPLTKVDRRWGAFPGLTEEQINGKAWTEKFGLFLKSLVRGDVQAAGEAYRTFTTDAQRKSMTEGTDTDGGYLVPEEFRAEVVRLIPKYGLLRRFARTIPMKGEVMSMPRQTAGVSVTWPGETGKGTVKKPTLGQVVLTAKKAVGLSAVSNELLADAGIDVIAYLQTIFAEAFAAEEDNQLFNGTGAPFFGLLSAQAETDGVKVLQMATGKTAITDLTIDNLIDLEGKVDEEAEEGSAFFFHKAARGALRKVKVTDSYALSPASQGMPGTINGIPWYTSSKLPSAPTTDTKFAAYGNLKNVALGDRSQMTIAIGVEGTIGSTNLFEQDMKALRITERISIQLLVPSAFAVIKTAAS